MVRNALALYGIQAAQYILPWITFPYLARVLGAEKFGLIVWAQAFIQYFVVITDYGFNFSATREISIHRDDLNEVSRIFSAVMIAKILLMAVCFVFMLVVVLATPKLRVNLNLFLIVFTTVAGNVLFPQWLFQGLEKMGYITAREIGARLLGLLPTFLLVHSPNDYLKAAFVQSGSVAIAGALSLFWMPQGGLVRFRRVPWRDVWQTYQGGFHIFLSTAAITLYTRSNMFILGFVASEREVGMLGVAQRIVDSCKSLISPISTALFPHMSYLSANRPADAVAFLRRYAVRFTVPFALISAGLFALAPLAIRIAGGPKYADAVPMLRIMSPIPLILAPGTLYATQFMLGLGYKKQWANMIIMGAVLNFAILIPLLRYIDAAIAVCITATAVEFWVLARSWFFYRTHRDKVQPGALSISKNVS